MGQQIGNICHESATQPVSQSFISSEEKGFVPLNRSSQRETELVPFKRRFLPAEFIVFPFRSVQFGVAQEFECRSVQLIGPGAGDCGEDASGRASVFCAIAISQDSEFADRSEEHTSEL